MLVASMVIFTYAEDESLCEMAAQLQLFLKIHTLKVMESLIGQM